MIITKDIVEKNIKNNTKLIALCHANNIVGTFNDIEDIGQLAKEKNILFLVDVAQSAGKKKHRCSKNEYRHLMFSRTQIYIFP